MEKVYSYIEFPEQVKRVVVAPNEVRAKRSLLNRKVRFKDLQLDVLKTARLLITGSMFSEKEYIDVLKTIKRYIENGKGMTEALSMCMLKPDENVSMLASMMYDDAVQGKSISAILEKGKFPRYVTSALKAAEESNINMAKALQAVIDFLSSELEVKKRLNRLARKLKRNLAAAVVSFIVVTSFIPNFYKLGKEINPKKDFGMFEYIADIGFFFRDHVIFTVLLTVVAVLALWTTISGSKFYAIINKIPRLEIIQTLDKRMIAAYVYLIISATDMPAIRALWGLQDVPKLPKFREKFKLAYLRLRGKAHTTWYDVFLAAGIDRLFTVKLKTAGSELSEEVRMLVLDFDELLENQMSLAEDTMNLFIYVLIGSIVVFMGITAFTFMYPM